MGWRELSTRINVLLQAFMTILAHRFDNNSRQKYGGAAVTLPLAMA